MRNKALVFILFQSIAFLIFISCENIYKKEKLIVAPYYLIDSDKYDGLSIDYKIENGDFIGRVPGPVIEYGATDSFLVAKSKQNGDILYYIINRKNDSEYGDKSTFLIGPLKEEEYSALWKDKFKGRFIKVNK